MRSNSNYLRAPGNNQLICYCFGYTKHDLEEDFGVNGRSLILERIMTEKKHGGCQCATQNPSGK
jgi:hypothetical protein